MSLDAARGLSSALKETRYLLSVPGMRRSIRQGLKTPARRLAKKLPW